LLLAAAIITLFVSNYKKKERTLDERITLRRQDKIPYGTWAAYQNLHAIFPKASLHTNRYEPGYWDSLSNYESKQLYLVIANNFLADKNEMRRMINFAEAGNTVFVSARFIGEEAEDYLNCATNPYDFLAFFTDEEGKKDSMRTELVQPPFPKKLDYVYPGRRHDAAFTTVDSTITEVLGQNENGRANFIRMRAGKGYFYLHLSPLSFSNYFLLHKENISYYENALSLLDPDMTKVVWDEYYLLKKSAANREKKKNWMTVLFRYPALKAALLTAMAALLLYVLLGMRRKQRPIPVIRKPKNDSLDFVKTIGRLYYDKANHQNLSRKMTAYFLEHVRNKYKLATGALNDEFVKNLQYKSGADESLIRQIVGYIHYTEDAPAVSGKQLMHFHQQLEAFYQKT
jgi:hypothetical protein